MTKAQKRVLVTRPEPGATATAGKLRSMGFEAIKLPLQEIRPLAVPPGLVPDGIAAVAVTSANAIRHAPTELLAALAGLACHTVGEATAATARASGFTDIRDGGGDAHGLADSVIRSRPGGTIVYLCGKMRLPHFEMTLAAAGLATAAIATYDTVGIDRAAAEIVDAVGGQGLDFALVYSANAAKSLAGVVDESAVKPLFEKTTLICISPRAAAVLGHRPGKPAGEILVAQEPTEESLLSLLWTHARKTP
ncbi:MAG: uroporphyrinogen-III synthase [Hyphomicrobiales bacterium]|nr:uroporphyrinogen-III synthase [Hyphomicrobiales bacterium]